MKLDQEIIQKVIFVKRWEWFGRQVDNLNGTNLQYILSRYFKYIAVTGFWCRKQTCGEITRGETSIL